MIYGPDTDGSYFVEVRKADGEDPVFPRANALWPIRARHSVRNF